VNFVLLSGQGKKEYRLWQFALVTCSPTPPLHVPLEEKQEEEEGAIYFLLFIAVIIFVVVAM
jgi:hypothetical protein